MKSDLHGPASRIAIVHPVAVRARVMKDALGEAGHRVRLVLPGPEALAEVQAHRPDLVVAHVSLAQDVESSFPGFQVPLISLAEGGMPGDQLAADAMLREPVDLESLRICVGGLLRADQVTRGLRRQVEDLGALYRLSWALSLEGGPKKLYGYIAEQAAVMLGAEKGLVLLYDVGRRQIVAQLDGYGIPEASVAGLSYAVDGEASKRWNFRKNGPLASQDAAKDSRLLPDVVARLGVRSVVIVPMTSGRHVAGLLVVADRPGDQEFDEDDTHLLLAAGSLAAVAVENLTLHENIKRANTTLEEYDRLKSQFVGMVAHDFRRPLTAVRGFAELVLVDDLSGRTVNEYMRAIMDECDGLSRLADDTLLLAKLETANVDFRWSETDPASLFRDVVPPSLTGHSVVVDVPDGLPPIIVDAQRLRQVLSNLVSNAIKYSPGGGKITLRCRMDSDVLIQVTDQGLGIPKEQQAQVFGKFERLQTGQHQAVHGTGLGLYISRLIVQAHSGRIWVESEPGQGSTFCVRLPRDARPGRSAPRPEAKKVPTGPISLMFQPQETREAPARAELEAQAAGSVAPGAPPSAASGDTGAVEVPVQQPDDSQTAQRVQKEMRRTRRIRKLIPIRINYKGATLATYTAVINQRGALIVCAVPFEPGATLQITNLATRKSAAFEVVGRSDEEQGQYKLGVKLLGELDFWGPLYEPKPTDPTGALPKLSDLGPGRD